MIMAHPKYWKNVYKRGINDRIFEEIPVSITGCRISPNSTNNINILFDFIYFIDLNIIIEPLFEGTNDLIKCDLYKYKKYIDYMYIVYIS